MSRIWRAPIRLPRDPRKIAGVWCFSLSNCARPRVNHASKAFTAGTVSGTMRCLLPFPVTLTSDRENSMSSISSPSSSATRMPVEYSTSTMAKSRSAKGLAFVPSVSSQRACRYSRTSRIWACESVSGKCEAVFEANRRAAGLSSRIPCRTSQDINCRTEVILRAKVTRLIPCRVSCASQFRSCSKVTALNTGDSVS